VLELATNSTVTVNSVDPNLVYGTWALVAVSMVTLVVAAMQNMRTQRLMAEQQTLWESK